MCTKKKNKRFGGRNKQKWRQAWRGAREAWRDKEARRGGSNLQDDSLAVKNEWVWFWASDLL